MSRTIMMNLTGQRYGRLTVLSRAPNQGRKVCWRCVCDCGNETDVQTYNLVFGLTKSCGCYRRERASEVHGKGRDKGFFAEDYKLIKYPNHHDLFADRPASRKSVNALPMDFRNIMEVRKGSAKLCAKTHGMSETKLYRLYRGMINRCENPNTDNYSFYGARGIKVCSEWRHDFLKFHDWAHSNGYIEGLTLDRIDNDGDYCPENCRWVSHKDQMNNTRMNKFIEYNGESHTIAEWTRILNKDIYDIYGGLRRGWSFEDIVAGKPQKFKNRGELLEYNGEAHTRSEWSRITGLSKTVITYRLNHGWSMDRVLAPISKK